MFHLNRFFLIIPPTFLFFLQINSIDVCQCGRACPDNYTCSSDGGNFCCQNDTCDMLSRWSLLKSKCPYDERETCPNDQYCVKNERCITKEIAICDNYIQIMESSKCSYGELFKSFLLCSGIYSKSVFIFHRDNMDKEYSVHKCGESCFRNNISDYLLSQNQSDANFSNEDSCDLMEKYIINKVIECYLDCGICFAPQIVSSIFHGVLKTGNETEEKEIATNFSIHCNEEYLNASKKDGEKLPEIKRMVKEFIEEIHTHKKYNVTDIFEDLMEIEGKILKIKY